MKNVFLMPDAVEKCCYWIREIFFSFFPFSLGLISIKSNGWITNSLKFIDVPAEGLACSCLSFAF